MVHKGPITKEDQEILTQITDEMFRSLSGVTSLNVHKHSGGPTPRWIPNGDYAPQIAEFKRQQKEKNQVVEKLVDQLKALGAVGTDEVGLYNESLPSKYMIETATWTPSYVKFTLPTKGKACQDFLRFF